MAMKSSETAKKLSGGRWGILLTKRGGEEEEFKIGKRMVC